MILANCKKDKRYKRPHWEDCHILYEHDKWVYNNGSAIGEVVINVPNLIECDTKGVAIGPVPIVVKYTSKVYW